MPSTQAPAHFTWFPKLPAELRIKIWSLAREDPVLKYGWCKSQGLLLLTTDLQGNPSAAFSLNFPGGYHPALNVNRESRQVNPGILELEFVPIEKITFRLLGFQDELLSEDGRYRLEFKYERSLSFRYFLVSKIN